MIFIDYFEEVTKEYDWKEKERAGVRISKVAGDMSILILNQMDERYKGKVLMTMVVDGNIEGKTFKDFIVREPVLYNALIKHLKEETKKELKRRGFKMNYAGTAKKQEDFDGDEATRRYVSRRRFAQGNDVSRLKEEANWTPEQKEYIESFLEDLDEVVSKVRA